MAEVLSKGIMIFRDAVQIRYQFDIEKIHTGRVVGADQGISTCVTLSDGQVTHPCRDGHDMTAILTKLSRKKKGSKAFAKAQAHRTNYLNWAINQLDFSGIKEIRLEHLYRMGHGMRTSRFLSHFSYAEILTQMKKRCLLEGVSLIQSSNAYRSQRCSSCGFVHSKNRKGKTFKCLQCSHVLDADLNAAKNHEADICQLRRSSHLPNSTTGFYWHKRLKLVNGKGFTVPSAQK